MKKNLISAAIATLSIITGAMSLAPQAKALTYQADALEVLEDNAILSSAPYVLAGTNPGKWGTPGFGNPGGVVTYSFMPTGASCTGEFAGCTITALNDFMPLGYQTQIANAFTVWSSVANISFQLVSDDGAAFNAATTSGAIRFGGHTFDGAFGTLAHGYYPPNNGFTAAGDIHFDIAESWVIGYAGSGIDIFQVTAHEIGHALGLDHTSVANSLMNPSYSEAFVGPQADDIAGIQFIYGAPVTAVPFEFSAHLGIAMVGGLFAIKKLRKHLQ